jgi:hypothetical protein
MLTSMSVIMTLTKVIMTLIHVKTLPVVITVCDFHTHTVMNTHMTVIAERKV